jgi:hypothetical protein
MTAVRGLVGHGVTLVIASVLAVRTWTYDETKAPKHGETELWAGNPDQVQEVRFESKAGTLVLEPRRDSNGPYFVGEVHRVATPPPEKKDGAQSQSEPPPPPPKVGYFVATKEGEELMETLAPLRALRVLGKVPDAQKADFGFDKEEGRLHVRIGGVDHALVFGGTTPGGSDYYVKDASSGNAYVVSGTILRDLTSADQRLLERNLHAFEEGKLKRVKITALGATRELVKSAEKKDAWTKPSEPNGKDETATNWLSKLSRLHVTNYEGEKLEPPVTPADIVLKVEYFDEHKPIGFLELAHRPGEKPDKPEYVARTEHTRWYATVIRSAAEQIEQDEKSVVNP